MHSLLSQTVLFFSNTSMSNNGGLTYSSTPYPNPRGDRSSQQSTVFNRLGRGGEDNGATFSRLSGMAGSSKQSSWHKVTVSSPYNPHPSLSFPSSPYLSSPSPPLPHLLLPYPIILLPSSSPPPILISCINVHINILVYVLVILMYHQLKQSPYHTNLCILYIWAVAHDLMHTISDY